MEFAVVLEKLIQMDIVVLAVKHIVEAFVVLRDIPASTITVVQMAKFQLTIFAVLKSAKSSRMDIVVRAVKCGLPAPPCAALVLRTDL